MVGLSSIDGADASMNETTSNRKFELGRWYVLRLRVTPSAITAWIDDEIVIDAGISAVSGSPCAKATSIDRFRLGSRPTPRSQVCGKSSGVPQFRSRPGRDTINCGLERNPSR